MSMLQLYEQCELQDALRRAGRKLVVVAFTSGKCGPCRLTTPFLESLCPKMPDILFIKIDVSDSESGSGQDFVECFKITGIPAFYFFRNCNVVYHFQGANTTFLGNKIEELRFQI